MIARGEIEDTLIQFVEDELGLARPTFDAATPLFTSGVLDSFSLMALVAYAEAQFGVMLTAGDVVQETVDTVASLASLVQSQLALAEGQSGIGNDAVAGT